MKKFRTVETETTNDNKLMQIALNAMNEAVFIIDLDHKILQCNKATLDILGKSHYDEIIGHSCGTVVHGTTDPVDWCPVRRMWESGQREADVQLLNGKWVEISAEPVYNEEGKITGAVHIISDITARKKAEDALNESEQQYLTILNSLNDAMHVVDKNLKIIYQNPAMLKWLEGLNLNDDIIGKTIFEAFPFLDYDKVYNEYHEVFKDRNLVSTTDATKLFDRVIFTETLKIPVISEGELTNIITVLRDITDQKEAEEKLKESEENYKNIIKNLLDIIIILDLKGNFEYISPQVYEIAGFKPEEIIGKSGFKFMHPDDIKRAAEVLREAIEERKKMYIKYRTIHKDGYYIDVSASGRIVKIEGEDKVFAVVRDITEKKRVEQQLKESEEKFRNLFENSPNILLLLDQYGTILDVNRLFLTKFGYDKTELIGKDFREVSRINSENSLIFMEKYQEVMKNGKVDPFEIVTRNEEGSPLWINFQASFVEIGDRQFIQVILQDITEKKVAEFSLKKSEEKYRLITENVNDMIAVLNDRIEYEYINEAAFRSIMGRGNDELISANALRWVHPDDRDKCINAFEAGWEQGESNIQARFQDTRGKYHWLDVRGKKIFDVNGEEKVLVVSRDISERKEYEKMLEISEEKYRYLIENALEGVWAIDSNAITTLINPTMANILGYSVEEMIGKSLFSFMDEEEIMVAKNQLEKRKKGVSGERDGVYVHKNGNKIYLRIRATPIFDVEGNYEGTYAFMADITQRKIAEQKLMESEEKFRNIYNSIPIGMHLYKLDNEGNLVFTGANPSADKILSIDNSQFINKTIEEAFPPLIETDIPDRYKKLAKEGGVWKWDQVDYSDNQIRGAYEVVAFQTTPDSMVTSFNDITSRISAENNLKESEEKFRTMAEQSFMGIIILQDGVFKYFNEQSANMNGYSNEEIQNWEPNEFQKLIYPDDREFVMEQARKKQAGDPDVVTHYQYRIIRKDGEIRWVENFSKTINYEGKPADFVMTIDITDKIKAEESLKESEERYRLISENTDDLIVVFNEDGTIDYLNAETHTKILGYSMEKFKDKLFRDSIVHKDDIDYRNKSFNEVVKGRTFYSQFRLKHKNGEYLWFEVTGKPFLDDYGNKKLLCISRNINEKKQAEKKIKESEENFRTIAEQAFVGTLIIQEDKVEYVNNALLQIFDFSIEEIINWAKDDLLKLIYPEDLQYLREYRQKLRAGEPSIKPYYSYRVFTKYGKIKWIDQYSKPIIYREKPAELITIMDITEKKKAEEELMKLNSLKSELLRRTSHELKTPLVSIKGFSDLLLTVHREKLDDYVMATIREIKLGCERLENLIQDILKTAELESESVELKKSEEDLSFLIKLSVRELQGLTRLRNHEIQLNIHDKLKTRFEPDQIHLVLSNLINNAIKYTPPNGKIEIRSAITDDYIIISIEDNGIGLTSEEQKRLFTQFGKIERYGQGLDIISEGSGLGLYITKKIIELHGGTIRVKSKGRNKGSTFYFTLPSIKGNGD